MPLSAPRDLIALQATQTVSATLHASTFSVLFLAGIVIQLAESKTDPN
jgi:hypothetical protein